jgi:hypothetical protein
MNRQIHLLRSRADQARAIIREFNRKVPLTWVIRCSTRDMTHAPREISGGEDWFMVYRDYWKRRVDSLFSDYAKSRRYKEMMNSFRDFLKGKSLRVLENAQADDVPDGFPLTGSFALSFLLTFYSVVFLPDINKILRPILIDGEFKLKENRIEFDECYNNLIKLEDEIRKLNREIAPTGDYGERYAQARQDMSALPVKRRKIQLVCDEASQDAGRIVEQAVFASRGMINLLGGVMGQETNARYGALGNLTKIAGKENQFNTGLAETVRQFQKVISILEDIELTEAGR